MDMRRKQCEITDGQQIEKILCSCTVGRLATVGEDDFPYVTPVNYVWFRDAIYFHSAPAGEKLDNIKRRAKVCFEVDIPLAYLGFSSSGGENPCKLTQLYQCVVIRGKAAIVTGREEKAEVLNALTRSHEPGAKFLPVTAEMPALSACTVVRVMPDHISAKGNLLQGKDDDKIASVCEFLQQRGENLDRQTVAAIKELGK